MGDDALYAMLALLSIVGERRHMMGRVEKLPLLSREIIWCHCLAHVSSDVLENSADAQRSFSVRPDPPFVPDYSQYLLGAINAHFIVDEATQEVRMSGENSIYEIEFPERKQYPPLRESVDTDIAIIGGGLTGISAALHLAENGFAAMVLKLASSAPVGRDAMADMSVRVEDK